MVEFEFWSSDKHGLIRRRRMPGLLFHPEVWGGSAWKPGTPYVMDAITGMGEDVWSCGEWASSIDRAEAESYAAANHIDLYADDPDDPHAKYQ